MKASFAEALYLEDNGSANTRADSSAGPPLPPNGPITNYLPSLCAAATQMSPSLRRRRKSTAALLRFPRKPGLERPNPDTGDGTSRDVISLVKLAGRHCCERKNPRTPNRPRSNDSLCDGERKRHTSGVQLPSRFPVYQASSSDHSGLPTEAPRK